MSLPKVSIVIQAWSPKQKPYLDLCIRSIKNLDYPQELLEVIIIGKPSYLPEYPGCRTVDYGKEQYYASEGYNLGFSLTDPESKYIYSINDDVCLTRDNLKLLVHDLGDNFAIITGISPCDNNCSYNYQFSVMKGETKYEFAHDRQNYRLEDVTQIIPEMLNASSHYPWGLTYVPFICMYATLIPRRVYEKIGGFDTNFRGGPDDIDYCNRVVAAGGLLLCSLHVLTWHFGSVTIAESYPPDRWIFNIDYFKSKWGHFPVFVNQERYDAMKVRANALSDAGA